MAKEKNKVNIDDDFDFGADDFNFDITTPAKPKNKREVITDLATETIKATASNITDPSFVINVAKKSLPSEYSVGFNALDSTVSDVRDLYNSASTQVRPLVNQMKRVGKKVSPQVGSVLPKKMADKFKAWTETADGVSSTAPSKEQMRAANINQEIADFMVTQIQQDATTRNEEKIEKVMESAVEQIRHKDTLTVLTDMSKSLAKVNAYNDNMTNKFYQKMVSVNYQQLYILADTLEEAKVNNAKTIMALGAIAKNTGLPEFTKLENSERFKEITRNKFFGVVNDNLFQSRDKFVSNFITNAKKKIGNKISETVGNIRNVISEIESGAEQLQSGAELMEQVGEDKSSVYTMAGGTLAGNFAADKIGKTASSYLKKKLKDNPNVIKKGNEIAFKSKNMKHIIKEKLESPGLDWIPGIDIIRESASQSSGIDTRMSVNKLDDIGKPAIITGLFTRTVNTVIPGLLSRILREIRIIRTGDVNQDLTEFDFIKDTFNDSRKIKENIKAELLKKRDSENLDVEGNKIMDAIDPDKDKFTPEQRKEFLNFIMESKIKDKFINKEYLSSEESYRGKNKEFYAKFFKDYFEKDTSGGDLNRLDDQIRQYGRWVSDNRSKIQTLINAGYHDHVKDTGLLIGEDKDQLSQMDYYKKLQNPEEQTFSGYQDSDTRLSKFGGDTIVNNDNSSVINNNSVKNNNSKRKKNKIKVNNNSLSLSDNSLNLNDSSTNINTRLQNNTQNNSQVNAQFNQQNNATQINTSIQDGTKALRDILFEVQTIGLDVRHLTSIKENEFLKTNTPELNNNKEKEAGKSFNDTMLESINDIITLLKESNKAKEKIETIDETLLMIRDITYGIMNEKGPGEGNAITDPRRWWNKSIGSNIGSLFGAGKKGINKAIDLHKAARAKVTGAVSGVFGAGKKIFNKVFDTVEDVRMIGFDSPVLLAWKIKAGHYIDEKTGKVITNIKDITGDVRDIIDNEIVVRKEDIKKLFYVNSATKKIVSLKNFVVDKATALYSANMKMARSMISTVKDFTIGTAKKLYGTFLDAPCDVYIHPKDAPETLRRVLVKQSMRNGAYTSARTKKPIIKPSQIDSAVLDYAGKELLSEEDIQNGLFDENGKPIKTGFTRLMQYGKKAAGFIGSKVAGIYQAGKGIFDRTVAGAGKILSGAKDFMFGKDGFIQINGKKTVSVLEKIYKLLTERLPSKKKKVSGDTNDDGLRDNSYEDIKAKENEKKKIVDTEKIKEKLAEAKDKGSGALGAGVAGIAGLISKFKNKKKDKEDSEEKKEDSSWWKDTALGAGAMAAASWVKGKFAGKAAQVATEKVAQAGAQQVAKQGAMRVGGQFLARGALLGLQGLLSAGGLVAGAGTALAGLFSLPVLLGAAAIAATAAVGYGVYKGYKYLTRVRLSPLNKVRYAQYGFTVEDEEHIEKVFNLEREIEKQVKWTDNKPGLDLSKVNIKGLVENFGVDPSNDKAVNQWAVWFNRRFKHVLLNSITAKVNTKIDATLTELDKLQPETKLEYLKLAAFPDGPYAEDVSPFGGKLAANKELVEQYVKDAEAIIRKDMKDPTKEIKTNAKNEYAEGFADKVKDRDKEKPKTKDEIKREEIKNMSVTDVINRDLAKYKIETISTPINKEEADITSSRLHPITAIRLKAYGLNELDLEKVKNLLRLEASVFENIEVSSGKIVWNGSIEETLNNNYHLFGLTGPYNRQADTWRIWFRNRFMSVMMAFCTGLLEVVPISINFSMYKSLSKLNFLVDSLNPEQAINIASKIYSAKTNNGSPIWTETNSPWSDYTMNNDIKSIDGNMEALRKTQKSKVVPETTTKSSVEKENKATKPTNTTSEATNTIKKPESSGFFGDVKKSISDFGDKVVTNAKAVGSMVKDTATGAYTNVKESLGFIDNPGNGTGGDVNSLPDVKPGKGYAAYKDLLDAAAKMSGVDPKLLAIMTAIESNFNPKASPGTSAAQGLQQFIPSTWKAMLQKYGIKKYGINPKAPPTDVKASSLMAGEYIKENYTYLSKQLGRQLSPAEIYAAHMLGAGGANTLYKMKDDEIPALKMTAGAKANKKVFYHGGDTSKPRTAAELKRWYTNRVIEAAKQNGIDANYSASVAAAQPPASTSGTPSSPSSTGEAISNSKPNQSVNTDKRAISGTPGIPQTSATPAGSSTGANTGTGAAIDASKPAPIANKDNRAVSGTPGIPQTSATPVDNTSNKTALPGKTENKSTTTTPPLDKTAVSNTPFSGINPPKPNDTSPIIKSDADANKLRKDQWSELNKGNQLVESQNELLKNSYNVLTEISNTLKANGSLNPNNKPNDQSNTTDNRKRMVNTPANLPPPLIGVNTKYNS